MHALVLLVGISAFSQGHQIPKEHRVVIELNLPGPSAFRTVLENVTNLRRALKPDSVQIEVVCEGHGVEMLLNKSGFLADLVRASHKAGTEFMACGNTMRAEHIAKTQLLPFVGVVDAGVAEVVRKQEAGWAYLKGAH